ncbi:olfactory receptor 1L4-like [Dendropsophus ebraccatus]|uniref:olfactory receptor 1L4-like n=1 Tax=Dendropsophus ebraccatus TaxID=150705 RepID=UPI003831AC87
MSGVKDVHINSEPVSTLVGLLINHDTTVENFKIPYITMLHNKIKTVEFSIVGFSDVSEFQIPLFSFFLLVYLLTVIGNLILILLICFSPTLKTPMYFFLCNLSSLDIVYTTVTAPKLIHIFATNNGRISFTGCILQLFFFVAFWNTEYFLLTVMSYDRYVAICKPLHYTMIMNQRLCTMAAVGTWIGGMLGAVSSSVVTSIATYNSTSNLNHFFCDIKVLEKVATSDTTAIRNVILAQGTLVVMTAFLLTLVSYIYIISSILKIRSTRGKYKAFSTCASHLTVVTSFYVLIFDLYFRPKSAVSLNQGKVLTVLFAYIIPLLNPVIYSFRNTDVKEAFKRMCKSNDGRV